LDLDIQKCRLLTPILVIALWSNTAAATTHFEESFTCPIGSEEFKANVVMSSSTRGQRPDGRPNSSFPVYPIVECPANGLLLIKEAFTEDELAVLAVAIASAEYQSLRETDTPHYRVYWRD